MAEIIHDVNCECVFWIKFHTYVSRLETLDYKIQKQRRYDVDQYGERVWIRQNESSMMTVVLANLEARKDGLLDKMTEMCNRQWARVAANRGGVCETHDAELNSRVLI